MAFVFVMTAKPGNLANDSESDDPEVRGKTMSRFSTKIRLMAINKKLNHEKSKAEKAKADLERAMEVLKTDPSNENKLEALRLAKTYRDLSSKANRTQMQLRNTFKDKSKNSFT